MQRKIKLTLPPKMMEALEKAAEDREMTLDSLASDLVQVGWISLQQMGPRSATEFLDRNPVDEYSVQA